MNNAQCYFIPGDQDITIHGGFVPSLVIENEAGHSPMIGNPDIHQTPWVWGTTYAQACDVCKYANEQRGISVERAGEIVASSMRLNLDQDGGQ